jgi:thiosulfate dehydrogenase
MEDSQNKEEVNENLFAVINKLMLIIVILIIGIISIPLIIYYGNQPVKVQKNNLNSSYSSASTNSAEKLYWTASDVESITDLKLKASVSYGKELISHTSKYLGPKGSVLQMSNGLNCQNCHLDAGTKVWGNNFGSVASLYPKYRARSGTIESIYKRINDCFQRSLNGIALDTNGKEMQSIKAYITFIGSNVEKGKKAEGSGFKDLDFLERAANPENGNKVYIAKCQSCHQENGQGVFNSELSEYTYPALWGEHSFNDGAGLYRISNFAKFVKYNMPQGANYQNPMLSDEEAWDVAAFVLSRDRPHINVPKDWPDISKKPIDHPFGPYADSFTANQHKFGPFKPIALEQKKKETQKVKSK